MFVTRHEGALIAPGSSLRMDLNSVGLACAGSGRKRCSLLAKRCMYCDRSSMLNFPRRVLLINFAQNTPYLIDLTHVDSGGVRVFRRPAFDPIADQRM